MGGRTESRLATLMPPWGNQRLRRYAALITTLFFLSPASRSQWEPHPAERFVPLASRPAAVSLTATLESLSVSALSPAAPFPGVRAGSGVTLLTSWAIRANTTTLRLSGNAAPLAAFAGNVSLPLAGAPMPDSAWGENRGWGPGPEGDWPGISQPIGATNLPGNRQDWFDPETGTAAETGPEPPTIYILAQAL